MRSSSVGPTFTDDWCPPNILNFPTKDHWRSVAKLADITAGLDYLAAMYKEWGIESLAVPPLGCGEGQLDWRRGRPDALPTAGGA